MTFPASTAIEIPILQELTAIGGEDEVRFLYKRLLPYFPQFTDEELNSIKTGDDRIWRRLVQSAGKSLDDRQLIRRSRGTWTVTDKGRSLARQENKGFRIFSIDNVEPLSHGEIQRLLIEIGQSLGFHAEAEYDYYDVIWRETPKSPRISHVFEVQSKGNLDSAFAKLKRAFADQRSKPFLIVSTERDTRRALNALTREFLDIEHDTTILSFAEVKRVHDNLSSISEALRAFLTR